MCTRCRAAHEQVAEGATAALSTWLGTLHCWLETRDHERALRLYDEEVRPRPTDDVRDVANAVSLLWRLEQEGVAVGARWGELSEIALRRRRDTTLAFAALHNLLTLVAVGEIEAAWELVDAMSRTAGDDDQGEVMDAVAIELGTTVLE